MKIVFIVFGAIILLLILGGIGILISDMKYYRKNETKSRQNEEESGS